MFILGTRKKKDTRGIRSFKLKVTPEFDGATPTELKEDTCMNRTNFGILTVISKVWNCELLELMPTKTLMCRSTETLCWVSKGT